MSINDQIMKKTSKNGYSGTQTDVQNTYMKIVVTFTSLWIIF